MTRNRYLLLLMALGAFMASLQGCASHVSQGLSDDGKAQTVIFPPIEEATRSEGSFPDRVRLGEVAPGLEKSHLMDWFGPPHFHEGLAGVREWDYVFHLFSGGGITTCRYKVIFDKAYVARSFHWQPSACGEWLMPQAQVKAGH